MFDSPSPSVPAGHTEWDGCSDQEIADAIGQLHALEQSVRSRRLEFVAEYDRRQAWKPDGAHSMSGWLAETLHQTRSTARLDVKAGHALGELPAIKALYDKGGLSADQVAPLVRFATPDTDAGLAGEAPALTPTELARRAALAEPRSSDDERREHDKREVRLWDDPADPTVGRVEGRLPIAEHAKVKKALERIAAGLPKVDENGDRIPWKARMADALVRLAGVQIGADPDPDRATVVVFAPADTVAGRPGDPATLEGGSAIATETARRMACDSRFQLISERNGRIVDVGTVQRSVPPWLRRLTIRRDCYCRWPGCDQPIWEIHHIVHRANGGPTVLSNLVGLCWHHHHALHEGQWAIRGCPDGELTFISPNGVIKPGQPPPLRPDTRQLIFEQPNFGDAA